MDQTEIDALIDQVRNGRMTPDAADAEAVRLGHGPLSREPPENAFDPMGETWWTLPMTVAWIAWRTPALVRGCWSAKRRETWIWLPRSIQSIGGNDTARSGHVLVQLNDASLKTVKFNERLGRVSSWLPPNRIDVDDAQKALWNALEEGILEGYGIDITTGDRTAIPAVRWRDLKPHIEGEREVLCHRKPASLPQTGYYDIEFRRQNIMAVWPPHRLEKQDLTLPPLVTPEGPGYMPLYCAAQWIATKGGTAPFDPRETAIWKRGYNELNAHIASGEVTVTGVRDGVGEKLDPHLFASLRVDYPSSSPPDDLVFGEELYLQSHIYLGDEHWRRGFDDNLRNRRGERWSRLQVLRADVAHRWPFGLGSSLLEGETELSIRTGLPGRPTPVHLIEAEHSDRWDRGVAEKGIGAEARALRAWFKENHPSLPQLEQSSVENRIREEYWRRAGRPQK